MVRHSRWRSVFGHLGLWTATGAAIFYFAHNAMTGAHGLNAKRQFETEIASLKTTLGEMRGKRKGLEHRLELLGNDTLDPDLLQEVARQRLGWLGPRDRVLLIPPR